MVMKTSDFKGFITPDEAGPIFDEARRASVYQQLIPRVPLGANGVSIPVRRGKTVANWTAETGQKPKTDLAKELLYIEPKKLAAIVVMSAEVVRANPGNITQELRRDLAGAFALAFDLAVGFDVGGDGTGNGPFDHHLAETSKSVTLGSAATPVGGIHGDLVAGMRLLIEDGRKLRGFALDEVMEPRFWGAVDATGHPLYTDLPSDDTSQTIARAGRLLGRPSFMGEGVGHGDVVGFGGDFSKAAWGVVGGISFRVSTEASVTVDGKLTSAFENNLVLLIAEAEFGFVMDDPEHFVRYEMPGVSGGGED